jgi:hypothetical protein
MPTPPDNKVKSYSHFAAHCSVTAKAQDKFTRHQNVERYRRLLKTATNEERRNYLGRLIVEEEQKQKDAGDSEYHIEDNPGARLAAGGTERNSILRMSSVEKI